MLEFELLGDTGTLDVELESNTEALGFSLLGGTKDYKRLDNKPKINNVELVDNKTLHELGIQPEGNYIVDEDYTHTDNNYTDNEKTKLASLENYDDTEVRQLIDTKQPAGNYITNTTYASTSRPGIVKVNAGFGTSMTGDMLSGVTRDYNTYRTTDSDSLLISKGTLENVVTGKGLYSKPTGGIPATDLTSEVQTSLGKANDVDTKQNITDNTLTTTNKTIPTAINEVNSIAKGANQALSYGNYPTMITAFNNLDDDVYNVGQNIYIITTEVPDLWISSIESTSVQYDYRGDVNFVNSLKTNGYVQVGYYKLSALETQKVDLTNYVQKTDYASGTVGGVIKSSANYGTQVASSGIFYGSTRTYAQYNDGNSNVLICKGTLENVITGKGLYSKPDDGIPKTDLTSEVQTSLDKADTALQEHQSLEGYVTTTDYADSDIGGVVKVSTSNGFSMSSGSLRASTLTYSAYESAANNVNIGKATLENVITGKNLATKGDVPKVFYGTSATGASTAAKVVVCEDFTEADLVAGTRITVLFTNANSYNGQATLNINGTGVKNIYYNGTTTNARYMWVAGESVDFIYNGTQWATINGGIASTSYYGVTKLATSAGSDSQSYALTPRGLYYFANYSIAPYYSASSTYAVGDKVRYTYYIYECITAIETPEAWTAAHWQQVDTVQEQIDALENRIAALENLLQNN